MKMHLNLKTIEKPLIFVGGITAGSVATWLIVKNKYKSQAQEEIDSVKETFARINQEAIEKAAAAKNKPDISIYAEALARAHQYSEPEKEETVEYPDTEVEDDEPEETPTYLYEITPSEFASYTNDRTKVTLFRFTDDVFTDEMYERVDPRDWLDGYLMLLDDSEPVDPIDYIRKMRKDEICVRNFDSNLDIDICTQDMTYSDYMST